MSELHNSLERAIEELGTSANNIADQLLACRKFNRLLVKALEEIAENSPCDCGASITARFALNGGAQ